MAIWDAIYRTQNLDHTHGNSHIERDLGFLTYSAAQFSMMGISLPQAFFTLMFESCSSVLCRESKTMPWQLDAKLRHYSIRRLNFMFVQKIYLSTSYFP